MKPANLLRWLKLGLWGVFWVGVLLIFIHRPLLRATLNWAGHHFAEKSGYTLDWQIQGSVISDLTIQNLHLTGSPDKPIQLIQLGHASVNLSVWKILTEGVGHGVLSVSLADAQMELNATPSSSKAKSPNSAGPLPDIALPRLDIKNINARVITPDGVILLREFSLLLDETKNGKIEIAEFRLPKPDLHFTDVGGKTELRDWSVTLTDFIVTPELKIPKLMVDFEKLQEGSIPFEALVHSGGATLETEGSVDSLAQNPTLDLSFAINQMPHSELSRWVKIPSHLSWTIDSASGQVSGEMTNPLNLQAELTLAASEIRAFGMHFRKVATRASMIAGSLNIESLDVQMDDQNRASLSGGVELMNRQQIDLKWSAHFGDFGSINWPASIRDLGLSTRRITTDGRLQLNGADVKQGNFANITGNGVAEIDDLNWRDNRIKKTSLELDLKEGKAFITKLDVRLDDQNRVGIKGDIGLAEKNPFHLDWDVDLTNLASLAPWIRSSPTTLPSAGVITSTGKSSGNVANLMEQDFEGLQIDGVGLFNGIVWQNARLNDAAWDASYTDGRVNVRKLEVQFDDRNTITAKGHGKLDQAGEFDAEVSASLTELSALSGWMELAKQPKITTGRASLNWKGGGKIADREIQGSGILDISELKLEGKKEVFALAVELSHQGKRAEITKLRASADKMVAEASMALTDTDLTVSKLNLSSGATRLLEGTMNLPLALNQSPRPTLPLDRTRSINVHLNMARMPLAELMNVMGQKSPVAGYATVKLDLNGPLSALNGQLSATLSEAQVQKMKGKLTPALLKVDAELKQGVVTVMASATQKPLQTLSMSGMIPMDLEKWISKPNTVFDAPLTAEVVLPKSDLTIMRRFVPSLSAINGTASVVARLSGTLRKPEWNGSIQADITSARINDSDIDLRDLKVRGTLSGHRLMIKDISGMVSGGEMRVSGSVDLTQLTDPELNLNLSSKQALIIRNDTMSLRADGNLTCTGPLTKAKLAGRVELVRGRVFKEIEFLPISFPDQLPPKPATVNVRSIKPSAPPLFANWLLDVNIVTSDPIRLLGNVLNGRAVADLHLSGTGVQPVLEGKISQQGAQVRLPYSKLELTRGDVIFTKDRPFDPQLDLQGDSLVGNTQVTVYATGAAAKPTLRFTSSPPLSEPEIATLLATGTTTGDPQTASSVAANRAAFLVVSQAYRKLFGKLRTSRNREDAEPGRTSLSFNPLSTQTSPSNISASYEISPNWQAEVGLGERGFRGMLSYLIRIR